MSAPPRIGSHSELHVFLAKVYRTQTLSEHCPVCGELLPAASQHVHELTPEQAVAELRALTPMQTPAP